MASTSTNKQPLLVDRPFLKIVDTSGLLVGTLPAGTAVDPQTAAGALLVDCTKNDGAIVEHLWTISREQTIETYDEDPDVDPDAELGLWGYIVNFYLCPSNTVFDPANAYYVTGIVSGIQEGSRVQAFNLPEVIAPVAGVGSIEEDGGEVKPTQFRALYVPKGMCLWACAVKQYTEDGSIDDAAFTPLACAQGGYY